MSVFGNECIFMHCLPANRGQEVAPEVIDGPQSVVWDEAQNRLHLQKEIIKWTKSIRLNPLVYGSLLCRLLRLTLV